MTEFRQIEEVLDTHLKYAAILYAASCRPMPQSQQHALKVCDLRKITCFVLKNKTIYARGHLDGGNCELTRFNSLYHPEHKIKHSCSIMVWGMLFFSSKKKDAQSRRKVELNKK